MSAPDGADRWRRGEQVLAATTARLADADLSGPSLLPGWDRARVLAHLAGNADGLVNLLSWARTGVETPMYASAAQRDDRIVAVAGFPPARLRAEVQGAADRLAAAVGQVPGPAWTVPVRTAQGRTVPASEVLWMRSREVWVHAVDLDAGTGVVDLPGDVLVALVDDVFATWARRGQVPDLVVTDGDRRWGAGTTVLAGSLAEVAAWVTGRAALPSTAPAGIAVPAWL